MNLSRKLDVVDGAYNHMCPGCGYEHWIPVDRPGRNGHRWTFDGDVEKPSFHPSINYSRGLQEGGTHRCHYWLKRGVIQFLPDSTHALAGRVVDLPNLTR